MSATDDPVFVPSSWGPELGNVFPGCDFVSADTLSASGTFANNTLSFGANGLLYCGGGTEPIMEAFIATKS